MLPLLDLFAPGKIQAMKKAVPKGDKKRKKEVNAETTRLEQELQEKHEQEMKSMEANDGRGVGSEDGEGMVGEVREGGGEEEERREMDEEKPTKKSRAQKRKVNFYPHLPHHTSSHSNPHITLSTGIYQEKKAQQERERRRQREEEEKEMELVDNPRVKERESLESQLNPLQLTVVDIQPDGNWVVPWNLSNQDTLGLKNVCPD